MFRGNINQQKAAEFEEKHQERMKEAKQEYHEIRKKVQDSQKQAEDIHNEAQKKAQVIITEAKKEEKERQKKIEKQEERINEREASIEAKIDSLEKKLDNVKKEEERLEKVKAETLQLQSEQKDLLAKVANFSTEEAKEQLLKQVESETKEVLDKRYREVAEEVQENSEKEARNIIVHSIQRLASDVTSEATLTIVQIPSDDMKGRIIGKEGRNINAFEQLTGVDVIVDDTPGSVIISGYDLVRRYIAKRAMEALVEDGRIHPTHIEESVEKAKKEVNQMIKEFGEKAVFDTGVTGLHPDVIKLLGRLRFRTSYGQNILKHSVEVSFLCGAIAAQLGANVNVAKKAGLLHDIGKAVTHEIEGPHAIIGRDILKKYNVEERVLNAVGAHHEDIELKYVEDYIIQAADMISGSRPGARSGSAEKFVKRMQELEETASSFSGVSKAYAIQAGREVRVIVNPEEVNDVNAIKLANDIAKKMEKELVYPGRIKIQVCRETRAIDYAQ